MILTALKKTNSAITQVMKDEPDLVSFLKEGDLIEAKLLKKLPKAVYFDLNKFGTAIVYGAELINARNLIKGLNVGDPVVAKIVSLENEDGFVELSLASAHKQKNWQKLKELKEKDEVMTVKISGANSGGLVATISDIKAFMPVSQLSNEHYPRVDNNDRGKIIEELRKFTGKELVVKIIDINPRANKLIISERGASEQDVKKLINQYKVGDVIDGIISGIADFGAFVRFADNPSIEGLIHISEIDHRLINNPKEIVKVDESVKAKIIEIKDAQVFLSLKSLKEDPWAGAAEKFKEGQAVSGVVYKYNPFGAYINLDHGLQGMIHVVEFGSLDEMKKKLELGKEYNFVIDSVRPEDKRIGLKLAN